MKRLGHFFNSIPGRLFTGFALMVVVAVVAGGYVLRAVETAIPRAADAAGPQALSAIHGHLNLSVISGVAVGMAAIGLILALVAASIAASTRQVTATTRAIARGDFSARVAVRGTTEARALAQSVNAMAADLERLYAHLGDEVERRSQELSFALTQARELQALAEAQSEEVAVQNEELQAQTAELLARQQQLDLNNLLLSEKNRELETANRLKTEFVASMSHELRTPLNAVIGFSQLLQQGLGGELSAEQREYVKDIFDAGHHLLAMINDILDLAKVEAGKMTLALDPLTLGLPMREAEQMIRPLAARRGLKLEVKIDPEVQVRGDAQRLRQVALNLLSNAVKFTQTGGTITATVRVSADGAFGELLVRDTGVGIAPKDHARIFEAFTQADNSTARSYEGTGLGLTLARRFVQALGGSLEVESELGRGATFIVRLPRIAPEVEAVEAPEAGARPLEVLVVDDDAAVLELLRRLLSHQGHAVRTAADGIEALAKCKAKPPRVLVLDLMMPKMGGVEVLSRVRALPGGGDVEVLVLSAKDPWGEEADRLQSLGAEVALKGSLHSAEFLARVAQLGARPSSTRAA